MRFLGIDYGTKRVGLALSDEYGKIAFPHSVLKNSRDFLSELSEIVKKEGVKAIVFGESLDYKRKENPIMKDVRKLKERIEKELKIRVYLEPEILTSAEARRARGRHDLIDASAAAIILQSFLERSKNHESR
ncbi:Holliday junction resolvase RuvX [candidate division WWE3 bacterium]|nr:Holliday junction resolvase RuvX [candidate division WWE3 bacterium]